MISVLGKKKYLTEIQKIKNQNFVNYENCI